jgi:hypothetical protein
MVTQQTPLPAVLRYQMGPSNNNSILLPTSINDILPWMWRWRGYLSPFNLRNALHING